MENTEVDSKNPLIKMSLGIFVAVLVLVFAGVVINSISRNISPERVGKVAVSIYPVASIVDQIGGGEFEIVTILPVGTSPHDYQPSASDQLQLDGITHVFVIGEGLDDWAIAAAQAANSEVNVVVLSDGIDLLDEGHGHDDEDEHNENEEDYDDDNGDHANDEDESQDDGDEHDDEDEDDQDDENHDPHYWLSPKSAARMANLIAANLGFLNETKQMSYIDNANKFAIEMDELISVYSARISNLPANKIITFHDAFSYLTRDYGFDVVASIEEFPGRTPSASYIAEVGRIIEDENVRVLFKEPQLSDEIVNVLASDYNAQVYTLDPIGGTAGRVTYQEIIRYNVETIISALE